MPMVGGILGGGGAGGRQPARPVRRGDLAALRELPEADAARWRRTIECVCGCGGGVERGWTVGCVRLGWA